MPIMINCLKRIKQFSVITLFLLFPFFLCSQQIDFLELDVLSRLDIPVRWENIEGEPEWLDGPKPVYHRLDNLHYVTLKPGETVTVRIEKGQSLRVFSTLLELSSRDIRVTASNGSGLHVRLTPRLSGDRKSLLIEPLTPGSRIVKITRPAYFKTYLRTALLISNPWIPESLVPYNRFLPLPDERVLLRRADCVDKEEYGVLSPGQWLGLHVDGPSRLRLTTRLRYRENDSRSIRSYAINCSVGRLYRKVLRFTTVSERRFPVFKNGIPQSVSRERSAYMDIPKGRHYLQLTADAPVYLAVEYLSMDETEENPVIRQRMRHAEPAEVSANVTANVTVNDMKPADAVPDKNFDYRVYHRLLDLRSRENGLAAAGMLRQLASRFPNSDSVAIEAGDAWLRHTFYRPLLPVPSDKSKIFVRPLNAPLYALYNDCRLQELDVSLGFPEHRMVFDQFLDDEIRSVPSGYFFPVPGSGEKLTYHIPPRGAPSMLRVALSMGGNENDVNRHRPVGIDIEMDDRQPYYLTLYPVPEIQPNNGRMYTVSPFDFIMAKLRGGDGRMVPFLHRLFPNVPTGFTDIPLPPGVNHVSVSLREVRGLNISAALSYRASLPYNLDEARFLRMLQRLIKPNPDNRGLELYKTIVSTMSHRMSHVTRNSSSISPALMAHYRPLIRLIAARSRQFIHDVADNSGADTPILGKPATPAEIRRLKKRIAIEHQKNRWLNALENWSLLLYSGPPHMRGDALLGRVNALIKLGEKFLAERELKGIILFNKNKIIREAALDKLDRLYRTIRDSDASVRMWAAELHRRPSVRAMASLTRSLAENGDYDFALMTGILVPPSIQPLKQLISAALNTRQYHMFDYFLQRLPVSRRAFWKSLKHAAMGNHELALRLLETAGPEGKPVTEAIREGLELKRLLIPGKKTPPGTVLTRWERWQQNHPGPHAWQDADRTVTACAGGEILYSVETGTFSRAFMGDETRPVTVTMRGPTQMKIQLRPIHSAPAGKENRFIDTWINIARVSSSPGNGAASRNVMRVPVSRNRPAPGLSIAGSVPIKKFPGTHVEAVLFVPPGQHTYRIDATGTPLLVRVFTREPVWNLNLLPRLTVHTCREIYKGDPVLTKQADSSANPDPLCAMARDLWLAEHETDGSKNFAASAANVYYRMSEPDRLNASALFNRLQLKSSWEPFTGITDSTGIYPVTVTGWNPQSRFSRIRRALLPPMQDNELVLRTDQMLDLGVRYFRDRDMSVEFRLESPAYLEKEPVKLELRLDGKVMENISLDAGQYGPMAQAIRIRLPRGRHVLSLVPLTYRPNHFIILRAAAAEMGSFGKIQPFTREMTRYYHIATHDRPVRLEPSGPQLLRVDRWEPATGETFSRYIFVPEGTGSVNLYPEEEGGGNYKLHITNNKKTNSKRDGSGIAYYRVFRMRFYPGKQPVYFPLNIYPVQEIPLKAPQLIPLIRQDSLNIRDIVKPGGQEDGTWSYRTGIRSRRPFLEEGGEQEVPDEFIQFTITKRFYNKRKNTYRKTDGIMRLRRYSSPSVGLRHRVQWRPLRSLFVYDFSGAVFAHRPHGAFIQEREHPIEWSAHGQVEVRFRHSLDRNTLHLPGLRLFGRYLSAAAYGRTPVDVDHDVYTPYKKNHRFGLTIQEMLLMQPDPDIRWWVKASLTTNEDFNPIAADHLTFEAGFGSRVGATHGEINGQWRRYFQDRNRDTGGYYFITTLRLGFDIWLKNRIRLELGAQFDREWDGGHNSFSLFASWHLDRNRGFFDFSPSETVFKRMRERRYWFGVKDR